MRLTLLSVKTCTRNKIHPGGTMGELWLSRERCGEHRGGGGGDFLAAVGARSEGTARVLLVSATWVSLEADFL